MSYLTVIPLTDAKNYLRIDDTLTEDDNQITRMINASLSFIENWTQNYVYARAKTYRMINGCVKVYDYPINSITSPDEDDMNNEEMTLYKNFSYGSDNSDMVLNIGHTLPASVPDELIEVAYEIIDILYHGSKKNGTLTDQLSMLSIEVLNRYKRFLI